MKRFFAVVTNPKANRQFEVGAWSEEELKESLDEIRRSGYEDLDECIVDFYTA